MNELLKNYIKNYPSTTKLTILMFLTIIISLITTIVALIVLPDFLAPYVNELFNFKQSDFFNSKIIIIMILFTIIILNHIRINKTKKKETLPKNLKDLKITMTQEDFNRIREEYKNVPQIMQREIKSLLKETIENHKKVMDYKEKENKELLKKPSIYLTLIFFTTFLIVLLSI